MNHEWTGLWPPVLRNRSSHARVFGGGSEVEQRVAVGADLVRVIGVAEIAVGAQRGGPLLHNFVDLLSGRILGQHLQVGRRRVMFVIR